MSGKAWPSGRRARGPQRGAALLTAMMIVTLVATLAAAMIWQQWRSVQVEAAERARAQAQWILLGAVDWARLILREDARAANRGDAVDHLGEPWALPLAEAKLSTFLAADKENTDDAPEAFLSGQITDAQSRYNLRNLIEPGGDFRREQRSLSRLMGFVGARGSAAALAVALRQSAPPTVTAASAPQAGNAPNAGTGTGTGPDASARPTNPSGNPGDTAPVIVPASPDPPLMPERVEQLAWLGVDAETIRRLAPYVTILPERTPVNLNTASKEVMAAVLDVDPADAERLVQARQRAPFRSVQQAVELLPPNAQRGLGQGSQDAQDLRRASTQSKYFEIRGRLRLQDRVVEERALVVRNSLEVIQLQRDRLTALDSGPP
jgi:general secretion pathway protein K